MITLGKIEAMRKQTGATFAEAKSALLETDGDLEAAIRLYRQRTETAGHTQNSTQQEQAHQEHTKDAGQNQREKTEDRWDTRQESHTAPPYTAPPWEGEVTGLLHSLLSLLRSIYQWGVTNQFAVYQRERRLFSFPLLAFLIVFLFSFWILPFVFIAGLCMGYSYHIERS